MLVLLVLLVSDLQILGEQGTTMHILKRYSAFEELHDTLKRSLPVSRYFFIISRLTAISNVVFSPPTSPYPTSKGSSCTLSSSFPGWPSQTTPILACKRFVAS